MYTATFLYYDDEEKKELQLIKRVIEQINDNKEHKIYFGLVLLETLTKVIDKIEIGTKANNIQVKTNYNDLSCKDKTSDEDYKFTRIHKIIEKIDNDGVAEIRYNERLNENYHYKVYKLFIEKINQSKFKNMPSNTLKEVDFKKGIYAVTFEQLDGDTIDDLNKYLSLRDKKYIGYCCFNKEDKLIDYLLYYNMYSASVLLGKLIFPKNIYFEDEVTEIIGEDRCIFIDDTISKDEDEEDEEDEDDQNSYFGYSCFDNFWDSFTRKVLYFSIKDNFKIQNTINIQSEDSFNFNYLRDMTGKLAEYCLNYDHKSGKDKAKVFHKVLNIKKKDFKFLEMQIKQGLILNKVIVKNIDKHGIGFQINIPICGKNNRNVWIISAWKYCSEETDKIHLVTAYIPQESKQADISNMKLRLWVDSNNKDRVYYAEIYRKAEKYKQIKSDNYIPQEGKFVQKIALKINDDNFTNWLFNNSKAVKYQENAIIFDEYSRNIYSLYVVFKINDIDCQIIYI